MKKFVVLLTVVAITCFSAMAFAADVTVGGSYEIRSRAFENTAVQLDGADSATSGNQRDTQNRIRIDVNAKAGDVKGKLQLESDFGSGTRDWGTGSDAVNLLGGSGYSTTSAGLGFREAWVSFNLPFAPVNVTGGHQLLTLGNGWFFRSMHFGSDAWVVANQTGNNTVAFVNVKVLEGNVANADDIDAYVLLDVFKISDTATVGLDFTDLKDRRNSIGFGGGTLETNLQNVGVNFNGKLGPVALKAEADLQMGKAKDAAAPGDHKFKGNQIVVQGAVGLDPVTVNFTVARGSGSDATDNDVKTFISFLDVDPHYTFLYEYKVKDAGNLGIHDGFGNTTAASLGVSAAVSKSVTVAADAWILRATKAVNINGATGPAGAATSKDLGMEVDLKVNWKLYDNLAWNWTAGIFKPGDAYDRNDPILGTATGAENVMGVQGVLAFKF